MFAVGLINWWYREGFKRRIRLLQMSIERTYDLFSIGLLLKTLFNPFRQISSNSNVVSTAPIDKLKAIGDKLFSRFFGMIIRLGFTLIGSVVLTVQFVLSVVVAVGWLLIPFSLVAAIGLMAFGVSL